MTTHTTTPNNFNITKEERVNKKTVFDQLLKQYKTEICLSDFLVHEVHDYSSLRQFIGKFDLELLLQLSIAKISSFSPANFNDFLQYMDQSMILLSCLWAESADQISNTSTKSKTFNLGDEILALIFDFFAQLRDKIRKKGEELIVSFIKKFFLEIVKFVDCNRVNKCIVPCDPDRNPYKNIFAKMGLKAGKNTLLYLENKIKKNNLTIDKDEFNIYMEQALKNVPPEEFECLLSGFKSTNLIRFLTDLFNSMFDTNTDVSIIHDIFDEIDEIIDIIPGTIDLLPADPCGVISLESLARIRLRREGKTEEEINNIIENVILEGREQLDAIVGLLQNNPFKLDPGFSERSDIANTIIVSSIDNIFNGIESIRAASETILKRILIKSLGEINIAFYWISTGQYNIPNIESIKESLELQIKPLTLSNFNLFDENFYNKYELNNEIKVSNFIVKYDLNDEISVYSGDDKIFTIKKTNIIDLEKQINLTIENQDILQYIETTPRAEFSSLFLENNNPLLASYFNLDAQEILSSVYKNLTKFVQENLGINFYFEQFNRLDNLSPNKTKFSNIDYFDILNAKEEIKEKLNV